MKRLDSYFERLKPTQTQESQNVEPPYSVETTKSHASSSSPTPIHSKIEVNKQNLEMGSRNRLQINCSTKDRIKRENIALSNISEQSKLEDDIRLKASLACVRFLLRDGMIFRHHDESESGRHILFFETFKFFGEWIDEIMNGDLINTPMQTSLVFFRYLIRTGLIFRYHDESESERYDLFLETFKVFAKSADEIMIAVLKNTPENHKMISPTIQKGLADACADLTLKAIIDDIGDDYFALLLDEVHDKEIEEQMTVVLRYVNKKGLVLERFIGIINVTDTTAESLKLAIDDLFSKLGLSLSDCRGQSYNGASIMQGHFNGLKNLILADNKSAFYTHCFAHQLHSTLVKVSGNPFKIQEFFSVLQKIATIVEDRSIQDVLRVKQNEIIVEGDIAVETTGDSINQEAMLKLVGDACWGSDYDRVMSAISLFSSIVSLMDIIEEEPNIDYNARFDAKLILFVIENFEFAFLLHLMKPVLEITLELSQALERNDQDLQNLTTYLKVIKQRFEELRDNGFDKLLEETHEFCNKHDLDIPNMEDFYCPRWKSRRKAENFTLFHYIKVEIFNGVIDSQLQELNDRFDNVSTKLIECVSCLHPRNSFAAFDTKKLIEFASFYPLEFEDVDLLCLSDSLEIFILDVRSDDDFTNLKGISELAQKMVEKRKDLCYPMIYLLVKLTLILPISTANIKRDFASMAFVKDNVNDWVKDDWFNVCMLSYIEYEVFDTIEDEEIMQYFKQWSLQE